MQLIKSIAAIVLGIGLIGGAQLAQAVEAVSVRPDAAALDLAAIVDLQKSDSDRIDAGIVRFRHYGVNQDDKLCVEAERTVLLKRKSHWSQR